MIESLRAKKVKKKEITNGEFELKKNNPKQIDKNNNTHVAHIHEDKENEDIYIFSQFNDDAFAMIGNEFCLNFHDSPNKVDMSYYYFSTNKKTIIYLYDMKKTFAGEDNIIHLIEQWKASIRDAKACIMLVDDYEISDIKIGVITENNDTKRRENELKSILHPNVLSKNIPSFIKSKHNAYTSDDIAKTKLLKGFDEGKVTIDGHTYVFDIREFCNKSYKMYFEDGKLK